MWARSLTRLTFSQLHQPLHQGGLGLSCPVKWAQSLLFPQVFHQLASGCRPALHFTGMVAALQGHIPLGEGSSILTGQPPAQFASLQTLLLEVVRIQLSCLDGCLPLPLLASSSSCLASLGTSLGRGWPTLSCLPLLLMPTLKQFTTYFLPGRDYTERDRCLLLPAVTALPR